MTGQQPTIALDYGGYAVIYMVSQNCPESRWKPGRLAGVHAGSHGQSRVRPLVMP
jgi:hypothetical protein